MKNPFKIFTRPERSTGSRVVSSMVAGASWLSVLALWISASSVYVNPVHFKWFGIIGLAFPLFLGGTVVMLFVALLFAPRRSWIPLLGIAACFGSIRSYIPFNPFKEAVTPDRSHLRVVSYNVHMFLFENDKNYTEISAYLRDLHAQIICIQEGPPSPALNDTLRQRFSNTSTPHYDYDCVNASSIGIISSYPIVKKEVISRHEGNGIVAYWLLPSKEDSLLVVNCHLRSNMLTPDERSQYHAMVKSPDTQTEDEMVNTSQKLASKIASSAQVRAGMADTLALFIEKHYDTPTIVCGDFNDTPISYSRYRVARTGMTDAFREVGMGVGRTFNRDAIYVRIDHMFCSSHFSPITTRIDDHSDFSDHYPIISTFRRKRE